MALKLWSPSRCRLHETLNSVSVKILILMLREHWDSLVKMDVMVLERRGHKKLWQYTALLYQKPTNFVTRERGGSKSSIYLWHHLWMNPKPRSIRSFNFEQSLVKHFSYWISQKSFNKQGRNFFYKIKLKKDIFRKLF